MNESFEIYDDRGKLDNITLYKKDIVFTDEEVILIRTKINEETKNILIEKKSKKVITEDFIYWYMES